MLSLVFSRRYSMAHRLILGGSPKCAVPHGHNEIVKVRLNAIEEKRLDGRANMIEPFERAKRTWHDWIDNRVDHALQLSEDDPLVQYFYENEPRQLERIMVFPGDPTTEALAACFMAKIGSFLEAEGSRLKCTEVSIEETPTNTVVLDGDAGSVLPHDLKEDRWWCRADSSINEWTNAAPLKASATA